MCSRRALVGALGVLAVLVPGTLLAIVNGTDVTVTKFNSTYPWAVALQDGSGGNVCSGELVSPTTVLTAAHCAGSPFAVVGNPDRTLGRQIAVASNMVHPSYDAVNHYYDVALLHLSAPVYNTTPVKIATASQFSYYVKPNRAATIAGWGRYSTAPNYSNVLKDHATTLAGEYLQNTWFIYQDLTTGPCGGDSGGPLLINVTSVGLVLMGVADGSNGDLCASGGGIAVYTNISQMLSFINTTNVPDLGQTLLPSAKPDSATTTQDLAVPVAVAANDGGFNNPVTVGVATQPQHGTAVVNGSPGNASSVTVTYTPAAGYVGADSFTYSITDGTSSDTGTVSITVLADTDHDGITDSLDNCTLVANPSQLDADGDGYGNACDADLNNSGMVTATDYGIMLTVLGQPASTSPTAAAADLNGDGTVTASDYAILRSYLGKVPGPSGLHPNCPPTCP